MLSSMSLTKADRAMLTSDAFRQIMGSLPTGITIVTARDLDDRPVGLTVNACTSVSLDPPQLLICLQHDSYSLHTIRTTSTFAVNILGGTQECLARRFADRSFDKFDGIDFRSGDTRAPILADVLAYAECEVSKLVDVGDHTIVVGRVVAGSAHAGESLVYFRRQYTPID